MCHYRWIATLIVALVPLASALAQAQEKQDGGGEASGKKTEFQVGDGVVLKMTGRLTLPGKVVGELRKGLVVEVQHVKGQWLWIRGNKSGWLDSKYVLPLEEGVAYFTGEIKSNKKSSLAYESRGHIYRNLDQFDKAIADYSTAFGLNPKNAFALKNRAFTRHLKGDYKAAIADYEQVLKMYPKDAGAVNDRGYNYFLLGQYQKARADYDAALRLNPEHVVALNNRAWLLATCPDQTIRNGRQALTSAQKACRLTKPVNYDYVDTLAAAYAEAGYFDMAVKIAQDAIKFAPKDEQDNIGQRLELYRQKKAYRSPRPSS